jgi:hypothetical protein
MNLTIFILSKAKDLRWPLPFRGTYKPQILRLAQNDDLMG